MPPLEFNFKGVAPAAGRSRDHVPPARYLLKIVKVNESNTTNDGKPMPSVNFVIQNPPKVEGVTTKGRKLSDNFPLPESASDSKFGLQKLRALLVAVGFKVDDKKMKIDLSRVLTNKTCWVEVSDNAYTTNKGQEVVNSQIDEYLAPNAVKGSASDDDDDDEEDDDIEEEDEEDEDEEDDEDSDDDDEEDDEEDEDEDEDDDEDDEDDEDEDEDEDEDDDEDEEEDEEPAPRARRRAAPKAAAKPAAKPARRARSAKSSNNFPI